MRSTIWALGLAMAALFAHSANLLSEERRDLAGRAIKVVDGDTIDVQLRSEPIRSASTASLSRVSLLRAAAPIRGSGNTQRSTVNTFLAIGSGLA